MTNGLRWGTATRAGAWAGTAVACAGLVLLALSQDDGAFGRALVVVLVGNALAGIAVWAAPVLHPDLHVAVRVDDPSGQLRAAGVWWRWVRPAGWLFAVQLVVGLAAFPLTLQDGADPDFSWFGVVPFLVLLAGGASFLLAMVPLALVLAPLLALVLCLRPALAGDRVARVWVVVASLLLVVTPMAVCLVLTVGSVRDAGLLGALLVLLGNEPALPGASGAVLWTTRALVLAFVLLIVAARLVAGTGRPRLDHPLLVARRTASP